MTRHVLFVHGLWIHADAWNPWLRLFHETGFEATAPGWPGDAHTAALTRQAPQSVAGYGIQAVTDHYARIAAGLDERPVVVGHSFGGLVAQKLLTAGLAAAAVAVDPAPILGVKALPWPQIRSALPVLSRKANRDRAVMLTRRQFRYGFGNTLGRAESDELYERFAIPGPGRPVFELTEAKKDPATPSRVDLDDRRRGPLLILGGSRDHTIPAVVARQAAGLYQPGERTEFREIPGRGHSLVFDSGWRDVAAPVLSWIRQTSEVSR